MKRFFVVPVLLTAATLGCRADTQTESRPASEIRPPAVAGRFYPDDASTLKEILRDFMRSAETPKVDRPIAIVVPHAGYVFSGQIAADAFSQAKDHRYDLVVILGTNHTTPGFAGVSIFPRGAYRTPLGDARIDEEIAAALTAADASFTFDPRVHLREHSVEVQVPFVQTLFPEARIVTAVVGEPDLDLCTRFGKALAGVLKDRRALIVASTDLSHYPNYDDAVAVDRHTLEAIVSMDPERVQETTRAELRRGIPGLSTCACGEGPVLAAMAAAKALGATRASQIRYANSGDVPAGDRSRVVGYGAVAFTNGAAGGDINAAAVAESTTSETGLSAENKKTLLSIARETIRQYLKSGATPHPRDLDPALDQKRGVFVTIKKQHELRGCIGHMAADSPLRQIVGAMAIQAATNDRRFLPVSLEELPRCEIEISVLTPYAKVDGPGDIVLGRDGILLKKSGRSAVYLPQVAVEQGWDLDETLGHLCRKAGLSSDCWKEDAEFYTFQSEVFSEAEFR